MEKNQLPNFNKIIKNGISGELQVTVPHSTIPSWPCLFSGLDVENLGYYTFIHPLKGVFNSTVWRDQSIFSIDGIKIFALNVPGTYPAWKINGEMISGILSPHFSSYPDTLEVNLIKNWIIEGKNYSDSIKAFELKKKLFLEKMKENFELMVFVIRLPDAISHRVLGDKKIITDSMNNGYKKIDNFLGEIFEKNNFDNILIFSDHGLKFYKKALHFPRWLEKNGLLYLNKVKGKKLNSILLKLYDLIRPLVKIHISKKIYRRIFNTQKREIARKQDRKLLFFNKDKPQTFIQKLTSNMGALFLFEEDLKKKDLIRETLKKDKYIDTFFEFKAKGFPDFLIVLKDNYIFLKDPSFFLKRKTEVFSHQNHGLFIAYGNKIKKGKLKLINYQDIAPTILKIFGKDKLPHMKGNPLDIFKT